MGGHRIRFKKLLLNLNWWKETKPDWNFHPFHEKLMAALKTVSVHLFGDHLVYSTSVKSSSGWRQYGWFVHASLPLYKTAPKTISVMDIRFFILRDVGIVNLISDFKQEKKS